MNLRLALAAGALAGAAAALPAAAQQERALTIGDAARLAATASGTAQAAGYRAAQAHARALEARSALLPHVSASWSDGARTFNTATFGIPLPGRDPDGEIIGPVHTVDFRGRVVANLLDPAGIGRYRAAQAGASAASADAAVVTQRAAMLAVSAYVRVLRAEALLRARTADSLLAAELLDIAQRQVSAGVGVALDVTRSRAQLAAIRAQLIAARNERDRARLELARAIGQPLTAPLLLRDSLGAGAVETPAESLAIATALRDRPELRAAVAATETARRALRAARAERFPSLGVFGDDGATSKSYSHLLNTYTYGVQLTLPLFEGYRTSAHVRQQEAALHEAEAWQRDIELQVLVDVRGALQDVAAGREQVGAAAERLALAEEEVAQSRERFRTGVAGNADVITAQLNLDDARRGHVDALSALELARASLARAQGHLLELP